MSSDDPALSPGPDRSSKVDVACPQCGARYRVAVDKLETKIECADCHTRFLAAKMVGRRVSRRDETGLYIRLAIVAGVLLAVFALYSLAGGKAAPREGTGAAAPAAPGSRNTHARARQLERWAKAFAKDDRNVIRDHLDLTAVAAKAGLVPAADPSQALQDLLQHESTRLLRELAVQRATLVADEDMTAKTGKALVYVAPKPDDARYEPTTRGEVLVAFRMEGEHVRVTGLDVALPPVARK